MTEHQIVAILKEAEAGIPVKELCRKYGMGNSTFYKWREKYGGMETSISNVYHSVTIAMSCAIVRLSRCAYDYQPKLQDDSVIISMLNTITDRHLRWGFPKCFNRIKSSAINGTINGCIGCIVN